MYYGWTVVAGGMVANAVMVGAFYASYGLFVLPIAGEFGLSRADANTGLVIVSMGIALIAPFLGRLLDKVSVRLVMKVGAVCFGCGLIGLALSSELWASAAILALMMPIGVIGGCSMTVPLLIVRWFKALPARAMVIANLGLSIGGAAFPLLAALLIESHGWRISLLALGCLAGLLLFGSAMVMRDHPGEDDRETQHHPQNSQPSATAPLSVAELLRSPLFWLVNLSGAAVIATGTAFNVSLPPLARDQGLSLVTAASLVSAMSAAGFAGKLILAVIGDRFDKVLILAATYIGVAIGVGCMMLPGGFSTMLGGVILIGLISGFTTPILNAVIADIFGRESFGTVTGLAQPIQSITSMVAIRFAGEVFDRTGNYDVLLVTKIAIGVLAGAIMLHVARSKAVSSPAA